MARRSPGEPGRQVPSARVARNTKSAEALEMFSAPAQRILDAVDEVEVAVLVTPQCVSREPEVAAYLGGLLGHAEVAGIEGPGLFVAHDELTDLARRQLLVGVRVDDAHVEPVGHGLPEAPGRYSP